MKIALSARIPLTTPLYRSALSAAGRSFRLCTAFVSDPVSHASFQSLFLFMGMTLSRAPLLVARVVYKKEVRLPWAHATAVGL